MKIKLLDLETALKVSCAIYPERKNMSLEAKLEGIPTCLFGRDLEGAWVTGGEFYWLGNYKHVITISSYFCVAVDIENEAQQRYSIYRFCFGRFDDTVCIANTDTLFEAVFVCENLNRLFQERPFYFDFRKLVQGVDQVLDYVPGEGFWGLGEAIDCLCLLDYHNKMVERKQ